MRMWLVKNSVPYDIAFAAPPHLTLAMYVTLGQFEGNKWSWEERRWLPRK